MISNKATLNIRTTYDILYDAVMGYLKDDGATHCAALTYYMFLAIIPIVVLSISISTYFLGSTNEAYNWVMGYVSNFSPDISSKYNNEIRIVTEEIIKTRGTAISFSAFSLIWISLNAICALEHSINTAWKLTVQRNALMRRIISLSFMLLIGLLLGSSTLLSAFIHTLPDNWVTSFHQENMSKLWSYLTILSTYFIYFLAFLLMYWLMIRVKVPAKAIIYASLLGAISWGITKVIFSWFVVNFAQYSKIYGSIAGIMILMIWLYFSVVIIVFCAELGYAISLRCNYKNQIKI